MSKLLTGSELARRAVNVVKNYDTVYMWGSFGHKVNKNFIDQKAAQYPNWYTTSKRMSLEKLTRSGKQYWAFDCVGLIKGLLWGWCGDKAKTRGGVVYPTKAAVAAGAVPDTSADGIIKCCTGVSKDFRNIKTGEAVWTPGHIGIYIGDGLAVEATPAWENCVQITAVGNIRRVDGYPTRNWSKHGKLKWVDYVENSVEGVEDMVYYEKLTDVPAGEMREAVQNLVNAGVIKGTGNGLHLSEDMVRLLVYLNRLGVIK